MLLKHKKDILKKLYFEEYANMVRTKERKDKEMVSLKKRNQEVRNQINLVSCKPKTKKTALYCGNVKY